MVDGEIIAAGMSEGSTSVIAIEENEATTSQHRPVFSLTTRRQITSTHPMRTKEKADLVLFATERRAGGNRA